MERCGLGKVRFLVVTLTLALSLRERGLVDTFACPCDPIEGEGIF